MRSAELVSGSPQTRNSHLDAASSAAETRSVFINATTGPLAGQRHGNSKEHIIYSRAVGEHLNEFMRREGVEPSNMAPDQARKFVDQVKASGDPRIRDFNLRIYQREINHILRLRGCRPE